MILVSRTWSRSLIHFFDMHKQLQQHKVIIVNRLTILLISLCYLCYTIWIFYKNTFYVTWLDSQYELKCLNVYCKSGFFISHFPFYTSCLEEIYFYSLWFKFYVRVSLSDIFFCRGNCFKCNRLASNWTHWHWRISRIRSL